jgi:hypothetical protein
VSFLIEYSGYSENDLWICSIQVRFAFLASQLKEKKPSKVPGLEKLGGNIQTPFVTSYILLSAMPNL